MEETPFATGSLARAGNDSAFSAPLVLAHQDGGAAGGEDASEQPSAGAAGEGGKKVRLTYFDSTCAVLALP